MRIVLNTRSDTAGAQASIVGLASRLRAAGVDATLNDWGAYERYDVAVFLGYDHELEEARRANPAIRIGLSDPKQSRREWIEAARAADFLLVGSVEQREAFLRLNANVFVLYMFPLVEARERIHVAAERTVVAYHGNRVHLESMRETVRIALDELGRGRQVELVAVYDVAGAGPASDACLPNPTLVPTRHVQWSPEALVTELSRADIGIVPNLLPIRDPRGALRRTALPEPWLAYEPFDHLLRLKASSNPNRLYPFARLGVPVVADLTPSFAQFVLDGVSGYLAHSARGWLRALELLADSPASRTTMAAELRARIDAAERRQVPDLLAFLQGPPRALLGRPTGERTVDEDLADLAGYGAPTGSARRERLRARLVALRRR